MSITKAEKIHRQGDLDGLCGVYSIVNSMSLLFPDRFQPSELFEILVRSFGRNTASVVVNGTHFHHMTELLKITRKYMEGFGANTYYRKACFFEPDTLKEFWELLEDHASEHGEGSVLIAIEGVMSHWSCVKKVLENRLEMSDGMIPVIDRSQATIKKASQRRPIVLLPNQAILIKSVNQKI